MQRLLDNAQSLLASRRGRDYLAGAVEVEDGAVAIRGRISWHSGNVPLPESHRLGIALGVWLHRVRPWALPGSRARTTSSAGALVGAGVSVVAWSLRAAQRVDLAHPGSLVVTGPYAISRNPMCVGWALLHLGAGVVGGSGWVVATLAPAAGRTGRANRPPIGSQNGPRT